MTPDAQTRIRISNLERKLEHLYAHLGLQEPSDAVSQTVIDLARAGQSIAAIKAYREETGAGLADAKRAVEALT